MNTTSKLGLAAAVIAVCLAISGCATLAQQVSLGMVYKQQQATSQTGANQQQAGAMAKDADMATVALAKEVSGEDFLTAAKAVVGELGYQIETVTGAGTARLLIATKSSGQNGRGDFSITTASLQLEVGGRSISASVQAMSTNLQAVRPGDAKSIANYFLEAVQKKL